MLFVPTLFILGDDVHKYPSLSKLLCQNSSSYVMKLHYLRIAIINLHGISTLTKSGGAALGLQSNGPFFSRTDFLGGNLEALFERERRAPKINLSVFSLA